MPPVNLVADAIEITQGIQDLNNSVDLVKNKSIIWSETDQGMTFEYQDVPAELEAEVAIENRAHRGEPGLVFAQLEGGSIGDEKIEVPIVVKVEQAIAPLRNIAG